MKKILSFLLLGMLCSIGNLWAADKAATATLDVSTVTSENWGTWASGTPVLTGGMFHISGYMGRQSSLQGWVGYVSGNSSSSSPAWTAPTGTHALGGSAYGASTYFMTMRTDRSMYFRVTGCVEVYALVATQSNGARRVTLSAYEYSNGQRAADASAAAISNDSNNDIEEISIDGLSSTKTYEVVVAGTASGNANFYEIAFAAPSAKHHVTYSAGEGSGTVPTQADVAEGKTFTVASGDGMTAPTGKEFDKWNDGTNDYLPGASYTMGTSDVTLTAQWRTATVKSAINYVNVYDADNSANPTQYSEGVGVASFEPISRDGYIFGGWTPASISAEATGAQTITATWYEAVDKIVYSWEGAEGGADEVGGTATVVGDDTKAFINYNQGEYYTLRLGGKNDYSDGYISISLNEALAAGDKIQVTGFYSHTDTKNTNVRIADGSKNVIWTSANLPKDVPTLQTHIAAANVPTSTILLTRGATQTSAMITKLQILRTVGLVSSAYSSVKVNHAAASADKEGNVITVTGASYVDVPAVAIVLQETYSDATNGSKDVEVENMAKSGEFFVGTVTIDAITYTVKVPAATTVTLTYKDGETTLGSEQVIVGGKPADYALYQDSALYHFDGWYSDAQLNTPIASISALVLNNDKTVYGKWSKVYAQSLDIEKWVKDNGTGSKTAFMANAKTLGFDIKKENDLDTLDNDKKHNNYPYLGLKFKNASGYAEARIPAGKYVVVKLGHMAAAAKVYFGEVEQKTIAGIDTVFSQDHVFFVENETILRVQMTNGGTCVLKGIFVVDYARETTIDKWGTICLPKAVATEAHAGADFYEPVDADASSVTVADVSALVAGKPYLFKANATSIMAVCSGDAVAAGENNGLHGNLAADPAAVPVGSYILSNNQFREVQGGTVTVAQNRAYLTWSEVQKVNAAPGRGLVRIPLEENNATAVENIEAGENVKKFFENGRLFILRDGVVYDATGKMVK